MVPLKLLHPKFLRWLTLSNPVVEGRVRLMFFTTNNTKKKTYINDIDILFLLEEVEIFLSPKPGRK